MKDIKAHQSSILSDEIVRIIAGKSDYTHLVTHGCLSVSGFTKALNEKYETKGLPKIKGTLGLSRTSHLYALVRELKLRVQDIDDNTLDYYKQVITEATVLVKAGENKRAIRLVKNRVIAPHRALVAIAAGVSMPNPDYWLFTDRQLLDLASGVSSLSALKNHYCTLHAHLKGRELETQYLLENPEAINNFYIDAEGRRFFSYPEVVTANYLRLNNIEHISQYQVPNLAEGTSPRQADFFLPGANLLIEISQNHDRGTGTRKGRYVERMAAKKAQYADAGYNAVFINTEPFFKSLGFDVKAFTESLKQVLCDLRIGSKTNYPIDDLGYTNNEEKHLLVSLPLNELVAFLETQGVDGLATLKNNFHFYLEALNLRNDAEKIFEHFTALGKRNRQKKTKAHMKSRDEIYASLDEVKSFMREHGISSQKQWFAFAPRHKEKLKEARIPAALPPVYTRLGTWQGWGALWPEPLKTG
ncbi:MAG: hypothetical protein JJU03_13965 [Idiomarina sp.]|nr:hypothetical protein [Idiomarina sp.]